MANLASSNTFLAAAKNNDFFAKYGAKPGGPRAKPAAGPTNGNMKGGAPAPKAAAPAANGAMTGNGTLNKPAPAMNGTSKGADSSNVKPTIAEPADSKVKFADDQPPISASTKMSAFTHSTKAQSVVDSGIPGLQEDLASFNRRLIEMEKAVERSILAPTPTTELTPPDTPDEAVSSGSVPAGKVKTTLSAHLASTQPVSSLPPFIAGQKSYNSTTLSTQPVPLSDAELFPLSFLARVLGGKENSPGLYYPAHSLTDLFTEDAAAKAERLKRAGSAKSKPKARPEKETYYVFDRSLNPFVPGKPGAHGAALTPLFNDFEHGSAPENELKARYVDVPLFVAVDAASKDEGDDLQPRTKDFGQEKQYVYMGQYTQARWSDRLSVAEITSLVPVAVLQHWSRVLASSDEKVRPEWMQEQLMGLLETKPELDVQLGMKEKEVAMKVGEFMDDLGYWKEDSEKALKGLTEKEVMKWFKEPDAGERPGLRLWWEYLVCTGYDRSFYQSLASMKRKEEHAVSEEQRAPPDASLFGDGANGSNAKMVDDKIISKGGFEKNGFGGLPKDNEEKEADDEEVEEGSPLTDLW